MPKRKQPGLITVKQRMDGMNSCEDSTMEGGTQAIQWNELEKSESTKLRRSLIHRETQLKVLQRSHAKYKNEKRRP
jgi:hypothetical protein